MSDNNPPQQQRGNLKAQSLQKNSQQWKDSLRRDCIQRAKSARRERLMRHRSSGAAANDVMAGSAVAPSVNSNESLKREYNHPNSEFDRYYEQPLDHCKTYHTSHPGDSSMIEARALVEQQLQKSMMGLRHCQQILPVDGFENASKKKSKGVAVAEMSIDFSDAQQLDFDEDECKMSEEEYLELINAVTEELEREDELSEEEYWELERLEALEHEKLLHDIDDFESWEADQQQLAATVYTSPFANASSPLVPCPICNSKSLVETPFDGIRCTNNNGVNSACDFQLDVSHDGLSLLHLQEQLANVYDEHSRECSRGVLKFRIDMAMLMVSCQECAIDRVVL